MNKSKYKMSEVKIKRVRFLDELQRDSSKPKRNISKKFPMSDYLNNLIAIQGKLKHLEVPSIKFYKLGIKTRVKSTLKSHYKISLPRITNQPINNFKINNIKHINPRSAKNSYYDSKLSFKKRKIHCLLNSPLLSPRIKIDLNSDNNILTLNKGKRQSQSCTNLKEEVSKMKKNNEYDEKYITYAKMFQIMRPTRHKKLKI